MSTQRSSTSARFGAGTGRIPETEITAVIEQTDMVALVRESVDLQRAGSSWKGLCPFHSEKTPSFHVNAGLKLYHCYGCGAGGNLIGFVRETRGLSFVESVEFLADKLGHVLEREQLGPDQARRLAEERSERGRLLDLALCAQALFREQLQGKGGLPALEFATVARGLTQETIDRFGVGAAGSEWETMVKHLMRHGFLTHEIEQIGLGAARKSGDGMYDKFRERLMYPLYTALGEIVGFGGRHVDFGVARASAQDPGYEPAKYMNSPGITLNDEGVDRRFKQFYEKGALVFGLYQAKETIRKSHYAIVVEGNIDVMTLHQFGFTQAVAPMGTAFTEQQCREIKRFTERVVLVFDGDAAGRKAAVKAVPTCLAAGLDGSYVVLPQGEDPDSFVRTQGAAAFEALIKRAPPMLNGYIDALVADEGNSVHARAKILQKAGPLLASIADPITRDFARDHMAAQLLERTGNRDMRVVLDEYLARLPSAAGPQGPRTPVRPDPTQFEIEIDPLEQELAKIVAWFPFLLPELERSQVVLHVVHDGLRLALGDLCAHRRQQAGQREFDGPAVVAWAQGLPDGRARRLFMQILVENPAVASNRASASLDQTLAKIHVRWLKWQREQLTQRAAQSGLTAAQKQEIYQQSVQYAQEIKQIERERGEHTRGVSR